MHARTSGYTFEQPPTPAGRQMACMKALLALVLFALTVTAQAQPRAYPQAELDALLAPVALYPDPLLSQILMAATYPEDVAEAARWSRANPQVKGEDAVRAVASAGWDPSVKSLVAFPEILARMDESPQWLADLGEAFLAQEPQVMATVQALRQRAQASGHLASNDYQQVQPQGEAIVVQPAHPHYAYAPYYDPYVVYGPWWWPAYRPVFWRPWHPAPVLVTSSIFFGGFDWHRHHVRVVHRPAFAHAHHVHVVPGKWRHRHHHAAQQRHLPPRQQPAFAASRALRVPEAQRQPIIQGTRLPPALRVESPRRPPRSAPRREQRPAATVHNHVFQAQQARPVVQGALMAPRFAAGESRPQLRREHRAAEPRREHRAEPRQQSRGNGGGHGRGRGRN
jgi:hypothetical protein